MRNYENMSLVEQIRAGLKQGIAHARGQLTLRTTRLPAPPPPMSRAKIARLRKELGLSQHIFAAVLNVSPKLVQSWEHGNRIPSGGNLRLLEIVQHQPILADRMIRAAQPRENMAPQTARRLASLKTA
ncbi:MAG TPA: helix-turn-helix domain-containing protein [Tepidisphaeraceae bacterium]|jgi:DNA-binding transcriptional regulator YiaG|nr:helix-turn-helix domain-containing protein [Tepidisphaeraceae bacterium]